MIGNNSSRSSSASQAVAVVRLADQLGETPAWSPYEEAIYWVSARQPAVRRYHPATGETTTWQMPEITPGLVVAGPGTILVTLRANFALLNVATGDLQEVGHRSPSEAPQRFNEMKCDRQGRIWTGEMNDQVREPSGHLYRLDADGLHAVLDDVVIPNTLCWSPDGTTMYFSRAQEPVIWQFDYDVDTGVPSRMREFTHLRPDQGFPDGATVDTEGYVWYTGYGGSSVVRCSPDGQPDLELRLPTSQITSCAFGGADLDTLYVTTAAQRLSPQQLAAQPDAGALFRIETTARGVPEADAVIPA
jgi:sugar lactone lactonase YvrE